MNTSALPATTTFTPVPDPLLGPILQSIADLMELKCILRALWHINQKKGRLRYVTNTILSTDLVLQGGLSDAQLEHTMTQATRRGLFLKGTVGRGANAVTVFVLNTMEQRAALQLAMDGGIDLQADSDSITSEVAFQKRGRVGPNVFTLYEQEIGIITPFISDELKEAEDEYPIIWIEKAIRESSRNGKRNWRYIEAILKRWKSEGSNHGKPRRHPKETDPNRYLTDYVQRRGDPPGV